MRYSRAREVCIVELAVLLMDEMHGTVCRSVVVVDYLCDAAVLEMPDRWSAALMVARAVADVDQVEARDGSRASL